MKLVGHERLMSVQQASSIRQISVIALTQTDRQTNIHTQLWLDGNMKLLYASLGPVSARTGDRFTYGIV